MVKPNTKEAEFYKTLGKNFRTLRQFVGCSTLEIAEIIDTTFQQVQKYESGYNRFPLDKLILALAHLHVPPEEFLKSLGLEIKSGREGLCVPIKDYQAWVNIVIELKELSNKAIRLVKKY